SQLHCTPAAAAPSRPPGQRIAVLVSGLSSTSRHPGITRLDTRKLGYADRDVAVFSYRGGQAPRPRPLPRIDRPRFRAQDSTGDLREATDRLRALLALIRYRNPGVAVDLIGHSQGGVIARAAVAGTDPGDPRQPAVANLITIGSPHRGANLATGAAAIGLS